MSNQLGVTMSSLKNLLHSVSPEVVVCIRGRHAVGKSEAVSQFAAEKGLPIIMRRLSQMTEGDLLGLPTMTKTTGGQEATSFRPCEWFLEACEKPVVLFLDERNRALEAVKQAVFEVCDSRALYGYPLHPETRVVIAENVGDQYQVQQCDPAEVSRTVVVELDPSVQEWLEYAKKYCHPATTDFIFKNPNCLEVSTKNVEAGKKTPDRRSWFKLDKELRNQNLFDDAGNMLFYVMSCGFLGTEVGQQFTAFCKTRDRQLGAKDILKSWSNCKKVLGGLDKIDNGKYVELANKLAEYGKDNKLTKAQVGQVKEFMVDCPPEPRMLTFKGMTENQENLKMIHGYEGVKELLVQTITGNMANKT